VRDVSTSLDMTKDGIRVIRGSISLAVSKSVFICG